MGKITNFFKDKFEKWKGLSKIIKISSIAALVLVLSIIIVSIIYGAKTEYATLFSNLEPADSAKVVEKLKANKVPYKVEGNTILVPQKNVDELRMSTISDGTISSTKGFELFDQTAFGMTDTEAQVKYQRALQGELERTISSFDEVEKARVHLVLPEKTVFSKETEKGRASVTLTLVGNEALPPEKVKAIVALVSGSVQDLPKENVEVMDSNMNLLTENLFDDKTVSTVSGLKQHELEEQFEKKLAGELQKSLDSMFGKDKSKVNINADLDFDSKKTTSIVYDKDDVVPRSLKELQETAKDGQGSAGAPGVDTNTGVNYPSGGQNQTDSSTEKKESVTNNEIGQTEEVIIAAPGEVKRLTASVMIDGNLTEAQKASVRNMVAAAVGFDSVNRRDVINVDSMVFDEAGKAAQNAENQKLLKDKERKELITSIVIASIAAIILIGAIIAIVMWRRKNREDIEEIETGSNINLSDGEFPISPAEYEPVLNENDEDLVMNLEKEIKAYAAKKPDQVIDVIKTWLSEDER